jgi:hypothetical protein
MSVLTTIQVKRVANFLKASCEKIPNNSDWPKLGQWLDILSRELGFKDWNVTSASPNEAPILTKAQKHWTNSHSTFLGVARVLIAGEKPTHHLSYSVNREFTRHDVATDLAKKLRSRIAHRQLSHRFQYSQPDVTLSGGEPAPAWKNRAEGCPIVIMSDGQEITIQLWWLREFFQLPENMPDWGKDSPSHYVQFDGDGNLPLDAYKESELNDSLTDVFLEHLTGKAPNRRTCLFVPRWSQPSDGPVTLRVVEGNPHGEPVSSPSGSDWSELRAAVGAYNAKRGLSSIDCEAISARYESAEKMRNEEEYFEDYSGMFDK